MPKKLVDGIPIRYEAYGKGETIVYLQSIFGGLNPGAYFIAGRLSKNYRIIIWDGPNNGHSGAVFKDAESEYHVFCMCLKGLLDTLQETNVHLAGCSGGGEMALLFAHLYPDMVKSVAMYRPTDSTSSAEAELVKARYYNLSEYAKEQGNFSGLDNLKLSDILRKWGNWMGSPAFYRANLSDYELANIKIPVLIVPCADDYHPESIALDLHEKLPASIYIPSKKHRKESEIYNGENEEHPFGGFVDFVNVYEKFLNFS